VSADVAVLAKASQALFLGTPSWEANLWAMVFRR